MPFEKLLRDLVRKRGLRKTARDLGVDSGNLYRSLMDGSNVGLNRIEAILSLFGYELKLSKRKEVNGLNQNRPKSRRNPKKEVV